MLNIILALFVFQPIEVHDYDLENGLKVLIYEDHFAPVVTTQVHYRVGSAYEPSGLTGISHMLEHMAFKGTKKYGPREYDRLIEAAGGTINAFTSLNRTVYYAHLRSDRYELELDIEADRMQNLVIAADEFAPEKAVVMEERRLRDNDPYYSLYEQLNLTSFLYSPYRNPGIGFMADIERFTRDDVLAWYKKYYNPTNAIVVVAGDVDPVEALRLVKKHYGTIKGRGAEKLTFYEPPQRGERRFELEKNVMTPVLSIHYHTVDIHHRDFHVLEVISMILSYGLSSRFEKGLVRERGVATTITTYHSALQYGGSFIVLAMTQSGISVDSLEGEILREVERLKREPVSDRELDKAKNQALALSIYEQDSPAGIGLSIGWWEIESGAWENMNRYPEEIQKVTADDVMAAAQKYFTRDNRTVGHLLPEEE